MKLRTQLLLAGALTLLLPLLAYRAVHQLDAALRQSRSDDLVERTHAAATLVKVSGFTDSLNLHPGGNQRVAESGSSSNTLYAERLKHSIYLDGFDDDWVSLRQPAQEYSFNEAVVEDQTTDTGSSVAANSSQRESVTRSSGRTSDRSTPVRFRAAISGSGLYIYIVVKDDKVVMHDPSVGLLSTGDHLEIFWQSVSNENNRSEIMRRVFRAVAPGVVQGHYYGPRFEGLQPVLIDSKTRGAFEVTNDGYQVELRIPLPEPNSLFGFAVVDRDQSEKYIEPGDEYEKPVRWAGTFSPATGKTGATLIYPSSELQGLMQDVVPAGSRLRVFDRKGLMRVDVNRLYEREAASELIDPRHTHFFNAVLFRFFEWIIRKRQLVQDRPFTPDFVYQLDTGSLADQSPTDASKGSETQVGQEAVRSYITLARDHTIGALESLGGNDGQETDGWLLYETNEDNTNAFTSSAMVRVFSLVAAVSMLVAVCLLGFATWLSFRIRRLSRAARSAVNRDGRFVSGIKGSSSRDEIGDLSRDFASLVERSRGYTQYLESLSAKLSHELRTPLSVVQTSLENIDQESMADDNRNLLVRAQGGSEQLGRLLKSMSEAARLEQSIAGAEFQEIDLVEWLNGLTGVYRDIYPHWNFKHRLPGSPVLARVVPELLVQALDKLVSNSTDFTPHGGDIVLVLQADPNGYPGGLKLAVENPGSSLDGSIKGTLFDPMVSSRGTAAPLQDPSVPHLGLGLYIVRLIAECHKGKPFAENTAGGVRIGFTLSTDSTF